MFAGLPLDNPAEFGEMLDLMVGLETFHHSPQTLRSQKLFQRCKKLLEYR